MPEIGHKVRFKFGTQSQYDSLIVPDDDAIYYITDTSRIYVGSVEYTRHVTVYESKEAIHSGAPDSFFVVNDESGIQLYYTANGTGEDKICLSSISKNMIPGEYGPQSDGVVRFGESIVIPYIYVNEDGSVDEIKNRVIRLPQTPALIDDDSESTTSTWSSYKIKDEMGAAGMVVDDELSTTSRHPVQNKVITNTLLNKEDKLSVILLYNIEGTLTDEEFLKSSTNDSTKFLFNQYEFSLGYKDDVYRKYFVSTDRGGRLMLTVKLADHSYKISTLVRDTFIEEVDDHIEDTDLHLQVGEREFWNNKVTCEMVSEEQIRFKKD